MLREREFITKSGKFGDGLGVIVIGLHFLLGFRVSIQAFELQRLAVRREDRYRRWKNSSIGLEGLAVDHFQTNRRCMPCFFYMSGCNAEFERYVGTLSPFSFLCISFNLIHNSVEYLDLVNPGFMTKCS